MEMPWISDDDDDGDMDGAELGAPGRTRRAASGGGLERLGLTGFAQRESEWLGRALYGSVVLSRGEKSNGFFFLISKVAQFIRFNMFILVVQFIILV